MGGSNSGTLGSCATSEPPIEGPSDAVDAVQETGREIEPWGLLDDRDGPFRRRPLLTPMDDDILRGMLPALAVAVATTGLLLDRLPPLVATTM
jgi:hypothetical protein